MSKTKSYTKKQPINQPQMLRRRVTELETLEARCRQLEEAVGEANSKLARVEKELNRFRTMADSANYSVVILDFDGNTVYWNEEFCRSHGYTAEETVAWLPLELSSFQDIHGFIPDGIENLALNDMKRVHPDEHLEGALEAYRELFATGSCQAKEVWHKRKDGSIFPVLMNGVVARNSEGRVSFAAVTAIDISDLKQLEQALRESAAKYRAVFESTGTAMAIVSRDGRFHMVNTEFEIFCGYPREELELQRNLRDFISGDEAARIGKRQRERARGNYTPAAGYDAQFVDRQGNVKDILLTIAASISTGSTEDLWICSLLNTTKLKRVQKELEALCRQEQHLREEIEQRVEERVYFTRALVHEIKTPLTPLLAAGDYLTANIGDPTLLSFANIISTGAAKLQRRVDELLDLSRGEVGMLKLRHERVDIPLLLREASNYMSSVTSRKGQRLVLDIATPIPTVWADGERIFQVVLNLLGNASKFSRKRRKITLRAGVTDSDVIVEVEDSGCGIDKKEEADLFRPYTQRAVGKEHLGGLGLGLALSKMLVELHGGAIWARSQKGAGSTFGFSIPLKAAGLRNGSGSAEVRHEASCH